MWNFFTSIWRFQFLMVRDFFLFEMHHFSLKTLTYFLIFLFLSLLSSLHSTFPPFLTQFIGTTTITWFYSFLLGSNSINYEKCLIISYMQLWYFSKRLRYFFSVEFVFRHFEVWTKIHWFIYNKNKEYNRFLIIFVFLKLVSMRLMKVYKSQ